MPRVKYVQTMEEFATRLREALRARNISQTELAEKLGIGQSRIGNWVSLKEENRREPPFFILLRICEILDTHPNYLLGVSDEMSPAYSRDMTRLRKLEGELAAIRSQLSKNTKR